MADRWRTGRTVGNTLYRLTGEQPSDGDLFIGSCITPDAAAQLVGDANGARAALAQLAREVAQTNATFDEQLDHWLNAEGELRIAIRLRDTALTELFQILTDNLDFPRSDWADYLTNPDTQALAAQLQAKAHEADRG